MAWTVTRYKTVFGNKQVVGLAMTADNATMTVETGLSVIEWITINPFASMASTTGRKIYINSNASGVASMGVLGCSGFAVGDDLHVTVYGR
jgi:hypothetical protein